MTASKPPTRKRRKALWDKGWPDHPELCVEVEYTVPFQDADPTGMAWHGNYYRYYDKARVALLDKLDFAYRSMEAIGQFWPIVDTRARFAGTLVNEAWTVQVPVGMQAGLPTSNELLIVGSPEALLKRIDSIIQKK